MNTFLSTLIEDLAGRNGPVLFEDAIEVVGGAGSYFRAPSLTTVQRDGLTPLDGYQIYNSTTTQMEFREGGAWVAIGSHAATHAGGGSDDIGGGTMIWTVDQVWNDNVGIVLGTNDPGRTRIFHDGTDLFFDNFVGASTSSWMIALADGFPSPDGTAVHIWAGTAGAIVAEASLLIIEANTGAILTFLTPNSSIAGFYFGDPEDANSGRFVYDHSSDTFTSILAGSSRLIQTTTTFDFQQATVVSTTAGNLTLQSTGDVVLDPAGFGVMVALAAGHPAPDGTSMHIWRGSAGAVTAATASALVIEDNDASLIAITILGPNSARKTILFGEPANNARGQLQYFGSADTPADTFGFTTANVERLLYSAGAFAFQEATTLSTTAGAIGLDPSNGTINLIKSVSGAALAMVIENTSNTASADVFIRLKVAGTTADSPYIHFNNPGRTDPDFAIGYVNDANERFEFVANSTIEGANLRMHLKASNGVLSVDGDGGGSDDPVSLFDAFDDSVLIDDYFHGLARIPTADENRRERNREIMIQHGIINPPEGPGEHEFWNLQPMLRLFAGGIYQTRALVEQLFDENRELRDHVKVLTEGR